MGPGSSLPSRAVMILSGFLRSLPLRDQLFGDLCLSLQPGRPGSWYIRAACSPAASRSRVVAITWRLAR
jgi:hypothetical protein